MVGIAHIVAQTGASIMNQRLSRGTVIGRFRVHSRLLGDETSGVFAGAELGSGRPVLIAFYTGRAPRDNSEFHGPPQVQSAAVAPVLWLRIIDEPGHAYPAGSYLVEFAAGTPLELKATFPLASRTALEFGIALCSLLLQIPAEERPYRDLCSSTILVNRNENGLVPSAVSVHALKFLRACAPTCMVVYPPVRERYDSPEVLRSEPADDRSMTFIVGAVIARLLAGKYPFMGRHYDEYTQSIVHQRLVLMPVTCEEWAQDAVTLGTMPDREHRPHLEQYREILRQSIGRVHGRRM